MFLIRDPMGPAPESHAGGQPGLTNGLGLQTKTKDGTGDHP